MLVKDLRQMLAEALRIGDARCVVLFTSERHTDTLSSGWFHGAVSPYDAVCYIHSMGQRWNHPIVCTDSSPTTKTDRIRKCYSVSLMAGQADLRRTHGVLLTGGPQPWKRRG